MSRYRKAAAAAAKYRAAPGVIEKVTREIEVSCSAWSGGLVWRKIPISLPRVKFLERPLAPPVNTHLRGLHD